MRIVYLISFLLSLTFLSGTAHAYIGPGLGAGALAAVLGIIGSVFVGLFAILYYPIKRRLKKKKKSELSNQEDSVDEDGSEKEKEE